VPPSNEEFEVVGAFNPAVIATEAGVVLLVRVAERPRERRAGMVASPRWTDGKLTIDWIAERDLHCVDPRVVRHCESGHARLTYVSHLRVVTSRDGLTIDSSRGPVLRPAHEWEEFGVEDPRITRLGDTYYVTYVAVSRHGAATALASTRDFVEFQRHGIIFCTENKDVVLFPERIGGRYVALHRPNGATPFTRPEMWIARSDDLLHWGEHAPLHWPAAEWESGRVGGGAPPVRVEEGWLAIYHANRRPTRPGDVGDYCGAALLLDAEDPSVVRARTPDPILCPQEEFETRGFVNRVVFPTGVVERGDDLLVYYGAADTYSAVAGLSRDEVLQAVRHGGVGAPP
jgi:predicted GH43/DUF377 family glycosyl hydrolase